MRNKQNESFSPNLSREYSLNSSPLETINILNLDSSEYSYLNSIKDTLNFLKRYFEFFFLKVSVWKKNRLSQIKSVR